MKGIIKSLWALCAMFILVACSGPSVYNPEKCAALQEKIDSKQELTDADYTEIINQLDGILTVMKEKDKEYADNEEKEKEFYKSDEGKALGKYLVYFGLFIDSRSDQLSNSNKRKLNKVMSEYKKERNK